MYHDEIIVTQSMRKEKLSKMPCLFKFMSSSLLINTSLNLQVNATLENSDEYYRVLVKSLLFPC